MNIEKKHTPTLHWINNHKNEYIHDITDLQFYIDKLCAAKKSSLLWAIIFAFFTGYINIIFNDQQSLWYTNIIKSIPIMIILGFITYHFNLKMFYKSDINLGCKIAAKYLKDWSPISRLPNEQAMHDYLYYTASKVIRYEYELGHKHLLTQKTRDHFSDAHRSICLFGMCEPSWEPYFSESKKIFTLEKKVSKLV